MKSNSIKYFYVRPQQGGKPLNKLGYTVSYIRAPSTEDPTKDELIWAVSRCSPDDNFCRKRGRELATNRLSLKWLAQRDVIPSTYKMHDVVESVQQVLIDAMSKKEFKMFGQWSERE